MRIELKPRVFLVSRPQINEDGLKAFLEYLHLEWPTPTSGVKDAERLVELMGRICYMSFGSKAKSKTNAAYIENLLGRNKNGTFKSGPAHGSVVEHPHWSFVVVGAGRGFSHEQVRHRLASYSQLSTRYCDFEIYETEPGDWEPGFCIPPLGQLTEETKQAFIASYKRAQEDYCKVLSLVMRDLQQNEEFMSELSKLEPRERERALRKAARGAARDVLPIGVEAILGITANARAIWNMAYLRGSRHAEGVIRDIYTQIVEIMEQEMPSLFNDVVYQKVWDGSQEVVLPREKI